MKRKSEISRILEDPLGDLGIELSPRERQVATLAARGFKIDQIAELLSMRPKSVEWQLWNISKKTGLSKIEMTRHMIRRMERSSER